MDLKRFRQFIPKCKMKVVVFICLLIFLSACQELGGDKTLTCSRKSIIDTAITGVWKFVGSKEYNQFELEANPHSLIILPFNRNEYVLMILSDKDSAEHPSFFKAIESRLSNKRIANVQALFNKPAEGYIYYPFDISGDTLYFWGFYTNKVSPKVDHKRSIKKFILHHFNDTNYFSSIRKYVRIKTNLSLPK